MFISKNRLVSHFHDTSKYKYLPVKFNSRALQKRAHSAAGFHLSQGIFSFFELSGTQDKTGTNDWFPG